MPNTTNFNWPTPADTDLVKDGAAAIRNLGNGVDTSLVDLKGGTTGQILSKASNADMDFTFITPNVGDITEVQAGVGISVASGTGPVPVVTNTVATAFDAAGDLVYGTGADTFTKLPIGTAGKVLAVNSGATAPEWVTPAAGGAYTLLTSGSLTGASVTSSSFSGAYTDLKIVVKQYQGTTNDTYMAIRFNSDSGTNYQFGNDNFNYNVSPNQTHIRTNVGVTNSGTSVSLSDINIPSYSDTSVWKFVSAWNVVKNTSGGAVGYGLYLGNWANTAAISTVTFFANTGNLNDGDYYIYGVK